MNADGSGQMRLTNNDVSDGDPAWSPDGTRIAFVSSRDFDREIFVVNVEDAIEHLDRAALTQLTKNRALDGNPAWSPDGKRIAFHSFRDGNAEIYAMNADGSAQTRLTHVAASDLSPAWSPDGTRIVFSPIATATSTST